jgi:hypothetical protein
MVDEQLHNALTPTRARRMEWENTVDDRVDRLAVEEGIGGEADVARAAGPVQAQVRELGDHVERRWWGLGLTRDGRHRGLWCSQRLVQRRGRRRRRVLKMKMMVLLIASNREIEREGSLRMSAPLVRGRDKSPGIRNLLHRQITIP